jgi:hypothetical protein
MQETYRPLYHEIFTKINNAKDKPKKLKVLQQYRTDSLEMLLKAAFDPKITWLIPEGDVPFMPNEAPEGTEHTLLEREVAKLHNYVQRETDEGPILGNPNLNTMKREMMFVQMLEGLSAGEAQLLCLAKDQSLNKKYKGLTANLVKEAFGWDENFVEINNPGYNRRPQPVDLGRTPADVDYVNRTG